MLLDLNDTVVVEALELWCRKTFDKTPSAASLQELLVLLYGLGLRYEGES